MRISNQFLRFVSIGISSVLIDLLVYKVLSLYLLINFSKSISFISGTIISYFGNKYWTFNFKKQSKSIFYKFIALYFFNLIINVKLNKFLILFIFYKFQYSILLSFVGATFVSALLNYLGMKYVVFK